MNTSELKEILIKNFAVMAISLLEKIGHLVNRFSKEQLEYMNVYKVKTKNYRVVIFVSSGFISEYWMIYKPKGFLNEWKHIQKEKLPECLVGDVFKDSCSPKERKRLVSKIMELKSFW
jgi:hypothetical protein